MPTDALFDPIQHIRERGRRLVVAPPDASGVALVYAVTHVHVPELAALPALDVARAQAEMEQQEERARRLAGCKTAKERARVEAEIAAAAEHLAQTLHEELMGTPARQVSYLERCRVIVCGAVLMVGRALPGAMLGARPMGTHPSEVCEVLIPPKREGAEPEYLAPLTISMDRSGPVSILDHDDKEVCLLATLFAAAFSAQTRVTPLPGQARDPAVGRSAGEAVRDAPLGNPEDRRGTAPGPGIGNRHSRRNARKGG